MGVPKFFRYTSERYPCLNELVKQYQIPDFDNMYLDMNGIIHNCSHPDDSNPHFRITEEKIFQDIFHYISILFQIIKPKKLFFMAIDGVAPRAKMNQQRGRRFRSAREAEQLEEQAKAKGEVLPTEKRFDSNCITPGTVFMARLHQQLRFFVKQKMSTDPLWAKVKVILSGHETPGEGEHKIMDYIRWQRSQEDYDPNTRHCLYGLDADLIMLGMCTHEPHFALLREEVKFGKTTQRATSPEETNFYLLHLSLLREYLEQEFISIKHTLPFPFDIEKVVDDWVLMGFLVGNDFIPNLPNMHISNDALPLLYKTYCTVLPTLDGYINESGDLHLGRFETFLQELAKIDREKFQDTYADLRYFEAKTGRRPNANERKEYKPNNDDTFNINIDDIKANKPDDELQALINATHDMFLEDEVEHEDDEDYEETSDEEQTFEMEFKLHKKDYYMNKLDYSKVTEEVLADQAEGYVRAIQWNLWYYYKGCPSWCWFYPHHYAPYISDIKGFKDLKIEFELGEPFKPFEQLLAVLPAASKHLLPTPFHELMTAEQSPIVHYYPLHFETDLNGKRNDWEAVVLIPFIDEANLLSAMTPCYQRLTEEELKRNTHGPMLVYNWTPNSLGVELAPEYFPAIENCHAIETAVWRQQLEVPLDKLKRGMLPNARRDMLFPGFPTMRHLKYTMSLKNKKVKVFDQPSRNDSMIVELLPEQSVDPPLEEAARELLGKVIWVGWPHLTRAKVISVSNEKLRIHHVAGNDALAPSSIRENNTGNLHQQWISERSTVIEHNMNRLGIELGDVKVIVHAVNLKGYKYIIQDNVQMVCESQWCTVPCGYALQTIVKDVSAYIIQEAGKFSTPQEAYPVGDSVFLLTQGQYYGCLATVLDCSSARSGRIKVCVSESPEPVPRARPQGSQYRTANHAAAACGISAQLLSRITGSVFVVLGERNSLPFESQNKLNIGLNLKFNKKNQEVSGYTRRCGVTNTWLYSERCIAAIRAYAQRFPELFDKLPRSQNNDVFFESELFPGMVGQEKPQEVAAWLKTQPHSSALRRECGSEALEPEEMKDLANSLDEQIASIVDKKVTLHVKWNLLYKPELHEGNLTPDPKADYKIYDRVICVAKNITAPLGAKGTITAIYKPPNSNTVRLSDKLNAEPTYQVMFDQSFPGAVLEDLFDEPRFYRMLPTNMLNISFGRKLRDTMPRQERVDSWLPSAVPGAQPLVWRRENSHNSAFASYSPTGFEPKLAPVAAPLVSVDKIEAALKGPASIQPARGKNTGNMQTAATSAPVQDNATHLLKSLLKISENETDNAKRNKNIEQQNWRAKSEHPPPAAHKLPPQNWREENVTTASAAPPPAQKLEWTNSNFKTQPPMPFNASAPNPLPQFQNPHFQQRNNQNNQQNNSRPSPFPKHLPQVAPAVVTLGPSWNKDHHNQFQHNAEKQPLPGGSVPPPHQPLPFANSKAEQRLNNPFVPLQVQTSQRRVQNPPDPRRGPPENFFAPHPMTTTAQPERHAMFQQQGGAPKPQKKRKPRIAANLPFQTD